MGIDDLKPNMKVKLKWPDIWVYYINWVEKGKVNIGSTREVNHPQYSEKLVDISEIRIIN